jgi:HEAT repeat protein
MVLSQEDDPQPAMESDADRGAPDREPTVVRRRRAVLAGHQGDRHRAGRLTVDPDPGVRAAAFGALLRLGALDDDVLLRALGDVDPTVRRRACVLAGRAGVGGDKSPTIVDTLVGATDDTDPSVVESAAWALGENGARCGAEAVAALIGVAGGHRSPLCREAAVAALGAVGAPEALPVILAALDDTANIRRRAAIALAAFDDPAAEEGLRRCLEDRDWQVRQAAEELGAGELGAGD